MPSDNYFPDERPHVNHGPSATGAERGKQESVLKKQAGPLPVYGWVIVIVGAYFLYRRMTGSQTQATDSTVAAGTVQPSPSQMMGGVFLLPSSGGGPGGAQADTSGMISADKAVSELAGSYDHALKPNEYPPQSNADLKKFYSNTFVKTAPANRASLAQFFAENGAKKNLGLPYITGVFDKSGNAQEYDPKTGTSRYINPNTGIAAS